MTPQAPCPSSSPPGLPDTPPSNSARDGHPAALGQSPQPKPGASPRSDRGKRHPKAKMPPKATRKKTLPEDKLILDAAYELNKTPDKAARRELVRRCIDMDEPRVQIWFQNRRQIDRRKSFPLSPAVEEFTKGRMRVSPDAVFGKKRTFELDTLAMVSTNMSPPEHGSDSLPHSDAASAEPADARDKFSETKGSIPWEGREIASSQESAVSAPFERPGESRPALSRSFSASTGYLSNRRNAAGSSSQPSTAGCDDSFRSEPFPSSCPPAVSSGSNYEAFIPRPRSQPSLYRLSMSLDGRAEITESTISPPRPIISRGNGCDPVPIALGDSSCLLPPLQLPETIPTSKDSRQSLPAVSLTGGDSLPPHAIPVSRDPRGSLRYLINPANRPPSLRRGRSNNVQAWEDCANSEDREDPLIKQAKHESSGSAIAAINLVRSTSSTSSCGLESGSGGAKRRAPTGKAGAHAGVSKRPKFSRSSSSRARLETAFAPSQRHNVKVREHTISSKPSAKPAVSSRMGGNDSDKENWSPDEDGNPRPSLRGAHSSMTASTLTSSGRRPLPSAPPSTSSSRLEDKRNPRRTPMHESSRRTAASLLQRGNTSPGSSWSNRHAKRYRTKPGLPARAQSALEIYEDEEEEEGQEEEGENDGRRGFDTPGGEHGASFKKLLSLCGVSPSKEKDVDAATGLLSLKWGR